MRRPNPGLVLLLVTLITYLVLGMSGSRAAPALPGERCAERASPTARSISEIWVWTRICEGEVADFNELYDRSLDPRSPEGWYDGRKLNPAFLETILLHEPWRSAIPRQGVRIVGAWFDERIDLSGARIAHALSLERSRFTADLSLRRLRTDSLLSLNHAGGTSTVDLGFAHIGGNLLMRGAEVSTLNLSRAHIVNHVDLSIQEYTSFFCSGVGKN